MIVQPQSPPQLKPNLRTWCVAEWNHLTDMSIQTFVLLAVPTIIVFWFNPFLPLWASALQLWAGQSWQWPTRWGSVRMWARQGGWFVGSIVAFIVLADAHIWFFPTLVTLVQTAWHDHLPGELGLLPYPLQYNNLFARLALLWPLAPTLALIYERIDPRTQVDPTRQLLPRDLVKPQPAAPPGKPQAAPEPEKEEKGQPTPRSEHSASTPPPQASSKHPKTAQTKQRQSTQDSLNPEQLTIDSLLTPDQTPSQDQTPTSQPKAKPTQRTSSSTGTQSSGAAHKRKKQPGRSHVPAMIEPGTSPSKAKPSETINWDDVAE